MFTPSSEGKSTNACEMLMLMLKIRKDILAVVAIG